MASTLSCLIVDDDPLSRRIIEQFAAKTDFLEAVASCPDAITAAEALRNNSIDLIFLDIEMPEMTGLELIKTLKDKPQVILITSKEKYALEAYEYDVTDYLLKPPAYPRFLKAAEKALDYHREITEPEAVRDFLFVKEDARLVKIVLTDIEYIEAQGDYITIKTTETKHTVYSTMKNVVAKLPEDTFTRVHRSFIVRLDKVTDVADSNLLIGKKIIPIGASHKAELMKRLNIL